MSPVTPSAITSPYRATKSEGVYAEKTVLQIHCDGSRIDGATLLWPEILCRSIRPAARVQSIHAGLRCLLCAAAREEGLLQSGRWQDRRDKTGRVQLAAAGLEL